MCPWQQIRSGLFGGLGFIGFLTCVGHSEGGERHAARELVFFLWGVLVGTESLSGEFVDFGYVVAEPLMALEEYFMRLSLEYWVIHSW